MRKNHVLFSLFMLLFFANCTNSTNDFLNQTAEDGISTRAGGLLISGESIIDMGASYTFTLSGNSANLPVDWSFMRISESGAYVNSPELIIIKSSDNSMFKIVILGKSGNYIVRAVTRADGAKVDFAVNVKAYKDNYGNDLEIKTYKAFKNYQGHVTYYENTDVVQGETKLNDKYGFRTFNFKPYVTHPYGGAMKGVFSYIYTTPYAFTVYDTNERDYLGWWYATGEVFYISFNARTGMVPLYLMAEVMNWGGGVIEYRNRFFSTNSVPDNGYRSFGLVGYAYPL